jgi:hypothetical protein
LETAVSETIRKPVEELSCAAILVEPVNFDWCEGYGERWDVVYPDVSDWTLQQCKRWLDDIGHGYPDPNPWGMDWAALLAFLADSGIDDDLSGKDEDDIRYAVISAINTGDIDGLDDWRECVRERMQDEPDRYTPMMNYHYALPELSYLWPSPEAAQAHLELYGGPVCLALVGDEPVLALTGGGMDLSDRIVEAYMLLGYLPPYHFCELPEYGGALTEQRRWVLDGCLRSCQVVEGWAQRRRQKLAAYKERLASGH